MLDHLFALPLSWQPSGAQVQQLEQLYQLVIEGNKTQNLTRITAVADFGEKHIWDSLRGIGSVWSLSKLKVLDIGTGAGFPGLPIAIAQPSWQVTLLDSTQKKIRFVEQAIQALGLENAIAAVGRAEQHQERYDLVVVRAVASASVCAGYSLPCLIKGGRAILYRGGWTAAEQQELTQVSDRLAGVIEQVEQFYTPLSQGLRHLVILRKL
ncbi:MAG: 16S rRNA (guanine(527)-N(7))-methyltransferase RsmG [Pseudanabaenaceae cyanobacterium bins.68]|nr:16S rRNA (guanine(527)-N(7))-methyltransferase RsmG [Pseudanabaenaceae cyanobacterium bins.68]